MLVILIGLCIMHYREVKSVTDKFVALDDEMFSDDEEEEECFE